MDNTEMSFGGKKETRFDTRGNIKQQSSTGLKTQGGLIGSKQGR